MRKLALLVALVVLLLVVFWFAVGDTHRTRDAADSAARAPSEPVRSSESAEAAAVQPEFTTASPAQETLREAADVTAAGKPADAECVVFGRVVDEQGQALSGLVVRLAAYKTWSTHAEAPRLPDPRELVGFETTTDAAGVFRFATPTPTNTNVILSITPEVYRDSLLVRFSARDPRARAPLIAGENDLGEFELAPTGAIEGYVRDSRGAPIEGAKLTLANEPYSTLGRDALSDASGRYVLGHVKAGEFGVNAKAERRLSQFRKPIAVESLRTTEGIDFVLGDAPTLRGVVVDEAGAPIEGAKVWCWPSTSGAGAGATSAADGSFTVYLPQDEPYTLECKREGFEPFGVGARDRTYPPGSADLRVVMSAGARTLFRVVDARNGEPLERFGITVHREFYSPPPRATLRDYPGGEVELAATDALDKVAVHAPGFQLYADLVEHDAPNEAVQTVRLEPANSARGRVLRDGEPVAGAQVLLEPGRPEARFADGQVTIVPGSFQVTGADRRSARCDGDGRFLFEEVGDAMYRVTAEDGRGAIVVSPVVQIAGGRQVDLGDLNLRLGGVVRGRVIPPRGRALEGVEVELDGSFGGRVARTDASGAFRFDGVRPGEHKLRALERAGQHTVSDSVAFELAEGATKDIELDLTALGVGRVSVTVTANGTPLANADVSILPLAPKSALMRLGKTDASGRVSGWARALGRSTVEVETSSQVMLRAVDHVLDVTLDSELNERVDFAVATLILRLPVGANWPAEGRAQLRFLAADGGSVGDAQLFFKDGALTMGGGVLDPAAATVELETVPARAAALELTLTGQMRVESSPDSPNHFVHRAETLLQSRAELQLSVGGRHEAQLR